MLAKENATAKRVVVAFMCIVASVKCNPPMSYLMQSAFMPNCLPMATQSVSEINNVVSWFLCLLKKCQSAKISQSVRI
jgi:hypothetical protein